MSKSLRGLPSTRRNGSEWRTEKSCPIEADYGGVQHKSPHRILLNLGPGVKAHARDSITHSINIPSTFHQPSINLVALNPELRYKVDPARAVEIAWQQRAIGAEAVGSSELAVSDG
jgi:hypothetical protein